MIVTKKSSIPSISLVFGEAQQVSSSQTAAEKLPQILRKANISPTLSSTSEAQSEQSLEEMPAPAPLNQSTNAHEVEQPEAPTTHDQCISPLAAEGSHSNPTLGPPNESDMTTVQPGAAATPIDLTTPATPGPIPIRDISVTTSSHRSWFASWTRAKEDQSPESGVNPIRPPSSVQASVKESSISPEPLQLDSIAIPSVPHQLPILNITRDVGQSTPPPSFPQDIPTQSRSDDPVTASPHSTPYQFSLSPAGHHSQPGTASVLSPLDEDVPKTSPAKLSTATPSAVLQSSDASQSTLMLNHSTSRFTLSIPLLGRPKPPLEQTVAAAQRDDIRTMVLPAESSPSHRQQFTTQESVPFATENPSAPVTETTEVNVAASTIAQPERMVHKGAAGTSGVTNAQTGAWWTYLGWSNAQASDSHIQTEPAPDAPTVASVVSDAPPQPVAEMAKQPSVDSTFVPQKSENDIEEQIESQKAPSVLSTDALESQGSAWYSPWSWYQGSSTPAKFTSSPPGTQAVSDEAGNVQPELSQDNEPSNQMVTAVPPLPDPQLPASDANPISSTITDNRSGWISFFSARAVAMKSITNESHNEEMEVMNLDEDESSPTAGAPSSATCSAPSSKDVDVPSPGSTGVQNVSPSSPSPAQKKPEDKSVLINGSANSSNAVRFGANKRPPSPTPSKKSGLKTPTVSPPNLVLPTWEDTFHTHPRAHVPPEPPSALSKTFQYVSEVLFAHDETASHKKGKGKSGPLKPYERALPRSWDVIGGQQQQDVLRGCQRAVVIGVHGWFPGAVMRTVIGEPTGTSSKFVNMAVQALEEFQDKHNVKLSKITKIPLEGEGTISRRVDKLYQNLIGNKEWMDDLQNADVIFFATHSQGSIVSTHILDHLITDGHIRTAPRDLTANAIAAASGGSITRPPQRVCCLALCGIHLGPLRYLSTSSLVLPYIQYFESIAARELFEFQNTDSQISRDYVKALRNVLDNGVKMVYIASLNDQVVGLYSGLFTSVTHPLILRALYIDGDAYHSSDFLSNLLVLLLRIRNAGLSDGGLLAHLSESTAGSLNGVGHSTAYEETATYSFAINYLFLSDSGQHSQLELALEPFDARTEQNDYEIPWALRDLIADDRVAELFSDDFIRLRDAFRDWQPKTAILRDVKRKLQPIQRLSSTMISKHADSMSKL